ncbi:PD-(D/E)XK nuclease family protein [Melghirimyces profundicolus]|uniref:PD-(D/E)XK nuclease family protein n=1 Tax=Melghirimyces profundicolus TaxID=1242148 RepID=UPI001475C0C2|nr:PD-(D/E)XK nuclease family protein [Melghirimyces profundicolus]
MAGTIYLHPVSDWEAGIGFNRPRRGKNIPCVVPGSRLVRTLRRRFHRREEGKVPFQFFTFDQFVRWLLSLARERLMTPVAQELVVQQAVADVEERAGFHYFGGMTARPGWLKKVEAWIGEVKRAGVRPARLKQLWEERGEKYRELALIYEAYQELLRIHGWVDHEEPYIQLCDALSRREGRGSLPDEVIVEQFSDLTFMQQEVLVSLVTAGVEVSLHLAWDRDRPRLFRETAEVVERLRKRGFSLKEMPRSKKIGKASPLFHLEERAFSSRPDPVSAEQRVEVISATDREQEVEQVVNRLKGWLKESQAPLSDAALVCNDPDVYVPLVTTALEAAGLPCEQGKIRDLRSHPLMQTLLGALDLRQGREESGPGLLESPYLPWAGGRETQSRWIRAWRLLGKPRTEAELNQRLETMRVQPILEAEEWEGLRLLFRWVEEIPLKATWREWLDLFPRWAGALKREEAWREMGRDPELLPTLAGELDAWKQIDAVLEEWKAVFDASALGGRVVDLRSFTAQLEQAADRKEVRLSPGRRGGVHLLPPNQVGGHRYKAVFMLGCAEGEWPRPVREDWLIPDSERRRLRREEVGLATSAEQRSQRLVPFYRTARAATERLVLSYPALKPDGKQQLPSPWLDELLSLFTKESVRWTISDPGDLLPARWEDCLTLSRGLEKAIEVLNRPAEGSDEAVYALEVVRRYQREHPAQHRRLAERIRVERLRWGGGYSPFDGVLDPSPLQREVGRSIREQVWSATSLNGLIQCRFHFLAGWIWNVSPREPVEKGLSPLERGDLLHRILWRFWNHYRNHPFDPGRAEEIREHLLAVAERAFAEAAEEGDWERRDPFRFRIETHRIRQQLLHFLAHEIQWRQKVREGLTPRFLELGFGMPVEGEVDPETRTAPAEVRLGDDRVIRVRGKVDRVDMDADGHYAIYDYKSGSAPKTEEILAGLQLQLLLYLWVLQEAFGLDPEKVLGAAYYTAKKRGDDGTPPTDNRNRGLWRKGWAERAGIGRAGSLLEAKEWSEVQQSVRQLIDRQLNRVVRGDFAVAPTRECPAFCPHRTLCRIDDLRMADKELPWEGKEGEA